MIIDYGMGNLVSVSNALHALEIPHAISGKPEHLESADGLILPGVGAFGPAMDNLRSSNLLGALEKNVLYKGKPLLGICLGLQLLAKTSEEKGHFKGLGWIEGHVRPLPLSPGVRVPHVGWSETAYREGDSLYQRIEQRSSFYYDHSYHLDCPEDVVTASFENSSRHVAAIRKDHIFGVQFHPEKSQRNGLKLLRNFANYVAARKGDSSNA